MAWGGSILRLPMRGKERHCHLCLSAAQCREERRKGMGCGGGGKESLPRTPNRLVTQPLQLLILNTLPRCAAAAAAHFLVTLFYRESVCIYIYTYYCRRRVVSSISRDVERDGLN